MNLFHTNTMYALILNVSFIYTKAGYVPVLEGFVSYLGLSMKWHYKKSSNLISLKVLKKVISTVHPLTFILQWCYVIYPFFNDWDTTYTQFHRSSPSFVRTSNVSITKMFSYLIFFVYFLHSVQRLQSL